MFTSEQNCVIWIYKVILLVLNAFKEPKLLIQIWIATLTAYTTLNNVNSSSYIFLARKLYILKLFGRITWLIISLAYIVMVSKYNDNISPWYNRYTDSTVDICLVNSTMSDQSKFQLALLNYLPLYKTMIWNNSQTDAESD